MLVHWLRLISERLMKCWCARSTVFVCRCVEGRTGQEQLALTFNRGRDPANQSYRLIITTKESRGDLG